VPFLPPGVGEDRRWWLAAAPWLWLSATAVFSYLAYLQPGVVVEQPWVRVLEWGPVLLFVGVGIVAWRRSGRAAR